MPAGDREDRAAPSSAESQASQRLEELVRKYARLVRSVAHRVGGSVAAQHGEDIEQRVFLELWKQISREQEITYPSSYIYRAAVRETVRVLKQERRHWESANELGDSETADTDPAKNPQNMFQAREIGAQMEEVLEAMALERQRAVRAHLSGFRVQEIMRLEDWSYNRARNLIARGMADLRRGLQKRGVNA